MSSRQDDQSHSQDEVVAQAEDIGRNTTDRERLQAAGDPAETAHTGGPMDIMQEPARAQGPLDVVQQASEESFPASDPPAYSGATPDDPPEQR